MTVSTRLIWMQLIRVFVEHYTVYPKKYAHGFCFAVLCCGYTLTDFPISIRLTSVALWQSNDCPSASKAILMNMDKYFIWIHYERLHNHNKAEHNKIVCIFLGIYCSCWTNMAGWGQQCSPNLHSSVSRIELRTSNPVALYSVWSCNSGYVLVMLTWEAKVIAAAADAAAETNWKHKVTPDWGDSIFFIVFLDYFVDATEKNSL